MHHAVPAIRRSLLVLAGFGAKPQCDGDVPLTVSCIYDRKTLNGSGRGDMLRGAHQPPSTTDVSQGNDTMRLRRITARRSPVHGMGLFALQPIAVGERVIEYKGEVTSWRRAA